ncbi:predicted protein [Nematostella vectensis]|uniref:SSD domain-containing protein n=1 Tax=Nematostella vectensis TaxID=45351 RepID=A7SGC1_NEMVE|nr:predicted protein [Nematostella vectensis]|eukprot:XP_001629283.1 predicted protein [Nematostella vectensis]
MEKRGIKGLFHTHGFLCASHPVEVLLLCITGTVCLLTLSIYDATHFETSEGRLSVPVQNGKVPLPTGIHVHVSTTSYFLALLCVFLQCKKLLNTGSRYLVGIVSIFSVFSCLVYTSVIGNIFGGELAVLREALPFFFLLNDFFAVGTLAKTALLANSYEDTPIKIAQGVSTLGPSMTLNTLVGTLVIGVGTLSGVEELETASNFGCLALLTHYLIFMTFLPACLSLFLELCDRGKNAPQWLDGVDYTPDVHEHVPNPLLQHVKIIMVGN